MASGNATSVLCRPHRVLQNYGFLFCKHIPKETFSKERVTMCLSPFAYRELWFNNNQAEQTFVSFPPF